MEFELELDPEDMTRLPRLAAVQGAVTARPRARRRREVWHDDAGRTLESAGLALAESRALAARFVRRTAAGPVEIRSAAWRAMLE